MLGGVSPEVDGSSTITCLTFHLSPFAIGEETSEPVEWSSISLLRDTDISLKVGHPSSARYRYFSEYSALISRQAGCMHISFDANVQV